LPEDTIAAVLFGRISRKCLFWTAMFLYVMIIAAGMSVKKW
jgi:hypothetical protein